MRHIALLAALSALGLTSAFAGGPKSAGNVSIRDDLLSGSGGGAGMSAGNRRVSGSFGQGGPVLTTAGTAAQGGYFGRPLVPPDPAGAPAAAQNSTVRTSSVSWGALSWTSPGENGDVGSLQAGALYDLRWASSPLTTQAAYDAAPFRITFSAAGAALAEVSRLQAVEAGKTWHFGHTTVNSGGMRSDPSAGFSFFAQGLRVEVEDVAIGEALQGQTTAFLKLRLWVDQGASVNWRTLAVGKVGTLPDFAVQNVGVYRDNNANGVFDGADPLITGSAVFSSSRATLSLQGASGEPVGTSTQTYFVAVTFKPDFLPVVGATISVFLDGAPFGLERGGERGPARPGLALDGEDGVVTVPYDAGLNLTGALTLELWLRSTAPVSGTRALIERRTLGAPDKGYELDLVDGVPRFWTGPNVLAAGVRVDDGAWHHVAAVYDPAGGGARRLYVDGLLVASAAGVQGDLDETSRGLRLGNRFGAAGYFPGAVDEVRVSKAARYNAAFAPKRRFTSDDDTVALYQFDASDPAGVAADSSGNGRHGTLSGGTGFHARSSPTALRDLGDILHLAWTDLSPVEFYRGQADVPMLRIDLWTGGDFVTANALSLARTGSGADADVGSVRVYRDNGDGVFDPGADEDLAGNQFFAGGKSTFNFLAAGKAQLIGTSTKTYFVAWDVAGGAGVGETLGLSLGATTEFVLQGSTDTASAAALPAATSPRTVLAAAGNVTTTFSTGTWLSAAQVTFQGAFGQGNVDHYRYIFDRDPGTVVGAGAALWSAGELSVTPTADADDWWFHVRSYDSGATPGVQQDFGPFFIDRSSPTLSSFAVLSATGGWLGEGQWTALAAGGQARIAAFDAWSGLRTSAGFSAEVSTDAGLSWAAASASLTGSEGATSTQTLSASSLSLIQSTNSLTCGGSPCGATNQVRFTASDTAGNVRSAGPYAVRVDTTAPSASMTTLTVSPGETLNASASGSDGLSGVGAYRFEASTAPDFSGQISSSPFQGAASWAFSGLTPGDTYYVRAQARDLAFNVSAPSVALSTFVWGTVFVSTADAAPASVQQGGEAALLRLGLRASPGRSTVFRTLRVRRLGTAPDADVAAVKLYEDTDADGSFDPTLDTLRASGALSSGQVLLDLGGQAQTITGAGKTFFVVYEVRAQAAVGGTLAARLEAPADVGVDVPYLASGPFPSESSPAVVANAPSDLNVSHQSIAPAVVEPGSSDVGLLRLTAEASSGGTSVLKEAVLYLDGSLPSNRVAAVKVWRDANGNGTFEPGEDWLLSSGADIFVNRVATVAFTAAQSSRTVVESPPARLFVSVSLTADAPVGSTFTVRLAAPSEFRLDTVEDTVLFAQTPMASSVADVQIPNVLTAAFRDETPAQLFQGLAYSVLRATLSVNAGQAQVNRVSVNRTGTGSGADAAAVKVYLSAAGGGPWDPVNDSLRGSAVFSGGLAQVDITTVTVNAGTPRVLFIVYEIAAGANAGNTLGTSLSNETYVRAVSPFTTVAGDFPFAGSNGTIAATVNVLSASALDQSPGGLLQGTANAALLRLRVQSDKNPISWTSLTVEKTGTLPDSAVSAVKLYRDENGNGTFDLGTDALVTSGADVFSGSSAVLGFGSAQSVTTSARDYFVALDLSPSAEPGLTVGVRVSTTAAFGVNSPNQVSTGPPSYPFNAGPVPVGEFPSTVFVATASLAPAGADPGQANVPFLSLELNTDASDADWLSLKIDRTGAGSDADVAAVKVFYDVSGLGSFDPARPQDYLLVTSSTLTFGSGGTVGTVTLGFSPVQNLVTAAKRYFLAADLSAAAQPGNTLRLRLLDQSYFSVRSPNAMAAASAESAAVTVSAPPRQLFTLAFDSAPATALQGSINVPMLSLALWMEQYSGSVSGLSVVRTGSGADADVSRVRLYQDNGDGVLNPAQDTQIATAAFSGGTAALSFAPRTVTTSTQTWFVAYDISQTASANETVGARIATPGSIVIATPHSVASAGFPIQSGATSISPTQSGVSVASQDRAPASLSQGATAQLMLSLTMNTTANAALVSSVELTPLGTAGASDITRLRIYRDDGNGTFEAGTDQALASLADPFAAGPAVVSLSPAQTVGTAQVRLWVAVDLAEFADPAKTFGLRVAAPSSFGINAPNYVVNSGFPKDSSVVPIAKVPDTLHVLPSVTLSADVIQGSTVAAFKLQAWAARQQVSWTRLKLRRTGSLADSWVRAALYRDDGDGVLGSGDTLVGSAAFSGGLAEIVFPSAESVVPATATYFAALALDLNATVGATVGAAMDDAGFFVVAAPDGVSAASLPLGTPLVTVLDAKTPTQPAVTLPDGAAFHSFESIRFSWASTVAQGSIASAQYAVGTTAGGQQTVAWTGFSPSQAEVTITGLSLLGGNTYYVSVRATSSFGFTSPAGTSQGRLVDFQKPGTPVLSAQAGTNAVVLSWAGVSGGPSGIRGYLAEYRKGSSPRWYNARTKEAAEVQMAGSVGPASVSDDQLASPPFAAQELPPGTLYFRVRAVSASGVLGDPSEPVKLQFGPLPPDSITGVSAYPNPFDSRKTDVKIVYTLPADAAVTVKIFDVFGRSVKDLSFGAGAGGGLAGTNEVSWDGTDSSGRKVSMGVYIAVIRSGGAKAVHKIGAIH